MVSKWRWNVYDMIGCTYSAWEFPGGVPAGLTLLCARLNPDINFGGKIWTHLLKIKGFSDLDNVALARIQGTSNVLNEVFRFYDTTPFPHGFSVLPDHPP